MVHIEVHNAFRIRGETSVPAGQPSVYRVFDFESDKDTTCYLVGSDRRIIPCDDARTMLRNGTLIGFAHCPRIIQCEAFENKSSPVLRTLLGAAGVGAILFFLGKD